MRAGVIECAFAGVLGRDPERREDRNGDAWCSFPVAVGEGEAVQWVRVAAFRQAAALVLEHCRKGGRVYVEGRLTLDTWTAKDGAERHGLSVAAWRVEPIGLIGNRKPGVRRQRAGDAGDRGGGEPVQAGAALAGAPWDDPVQF